MSSVRILRRLSGLALVLHGAAGVAQTPPPRDYLASAICTGLDNTYRCARAIEHQILAVSAPWAQRDGATLRLRLDTGAWIALHPEAPQAATAPFAERGSFSYFGQLPGIAYYLLHVQFTEGNAFAAVSRASGRISPLPGYPVVSPDARWLLVAEDGYFSDIGVFLFGVGRDSLTLVWAVRPDGWVPGVPRWLSDSMASVEQREGTELGAVDSLVGHLHLKRDAHRWHAVDQ